MSWRAGQATLGALSREEFAFELENVTKVYGERRAVDGLTMRVAPGSFLGLLGRNGAGKSTTLRLLTGLTRPTGGVVRVFGREVVGDAIEVKRQLGVMPEDMALLDLLTGPEYLQFVGRMHGLDGALVQQRQQEMFATLDLTPGARTIIADYSFGMKKKLSLCAALLHGPRLLFLDEPFEGIDPVAARTIKELLGGLSRRGVTLVLTSHVLEIIERLCPLIAVLDRGKLVQMGPREEFRGPQGESLEAVFVALVAADAIPRGELSWL